jgi:hypothetical protein
MLTNEKLNICSYPTIGNIHHHGNTHTEDDSSFCAFKLAQRA